MLLKYNCLAKKTYCCQREFVLKVIEGFAYHWLSESTLSTRARAKGRARQWGPLRGYQPVPGSLNYVHHHKVWCRREQSATQQEWHNKHSSAVSSLLLLSDSLREQWIWGSKWHPRKQSEGNGSVGIYRLFRNTHYWSGVFCVWV